MSLVGLTNIAAAFLADPELVGSIERSHARLRQCDGTAVRRSAATEGVDVPVRAQ
jgi:hypothetical protein